MAALTVGAIGALWVSVPLLAPLSLGWLAVAGIANRFHGQVVAIRIAMAAALAWVATMAGVSFVSFEGPDLAAAIFGHPAIGQHPVLAYVGFPWAGVEGNGRGLGVGRIPAFMGIDALLVNYGVFFAMFVFFVQRCRHGTMLALLPLAALMASIFGFVGYYRLLRLFD